jgi:hypothetical protein
MPQSALVRDKLLIVSFLATILFPPREVSTMSAPLSRISCSAIKNSEAASARSPMPLIGAYPECTLVWSVQLVGLCRRFSVLFASVVQFLGSWQHGSMILFLNYGNESCHSVLKSKVLVRLEQQARYRQMPSVRPVRHVCFRAFRKVCFAATLILLRLPGHLTYLRPTNPHHIATK